MFINKAFLQLNILWAFIVIVI